ncbi:ethanolamine ammonia-lyase reactivating factor EutA [Sedimenticola thiotaurini]|uniref:Reactivating factor for ethanolamine ammonia lyase n=1 Tax=Sedimenticola thiotaurini TaxID=1543721 RepID=A0A0F7JXV7_9GAMM|nr:ethanolamine ammonia-lyase reactivating factor EutA [Sedimenticola thiotaurini]AKH19503.1 reactivating factor for ethanolamine ammonia lyase [Sedimenticola thiotaurini]
MNRKTVHSVGVDIGTTTTQLIFSRLGMVNRAPVTQVPRYEFIERAITFQSPVIRTPLTEEGIVDVQRVQEFIDLQLKEAGLTLDDIETGAIIITGETSKARNARDTVMDLAAKLGDFVVATAGPNLESVIAGRGSGAGEYSKKNHARVLNIDIGGGTSNYVIFDSGKTVETACLNVGGHLLETDLNGRVTRIRKPALGVITELFGEQLSADRLDMDKLEKIADRMAGLIVETIDGCHSELCSSLLMTPALKPDQRLDAVFLSGGVGDCFYQLKDRELGSFDWQDIGVLLARSLYANQRLAEYKLKQPQHTLQATVIGAGTYTLSLSGSSIWLNSEDLPIRNIPVLQPNIDWSSTPSDVSEQVVNAGHRLDLNLTEDRYAIAFDASMPINYEAVSSSARQLANFYQQHGNHNAPLIIVTENDLGKVLGMELQPLINPQQLLVIDEVRTGEGDYIDIGQSFFGGEVVPLTIKSLAFPA